MQNWNWVAIGAIGAVLAAIVPIIMASLKSIMKNKRMARRQLRHKSANAYREMKSALLPELIGSQRNTIIPFIPNFFYDKGKQSFQEFLNGFYTGDGSDYGLPLRKLYRVKWTK